MPDNKEEVLNKIYELGHHYEATIHGCAQSTILALKNFFEIDDIIFKTANSLSGGIAEKSEGNCGAFLAGALTFSYFFGRDVDSLDKSGSSFKDKELTRKLRQKFIEKYNGERCEQIQTDIFGRSFNMLTDKGKKEMEAAGGHDDKCTSVVGNAAVWIAKILLDEGISLK